MLGTIDLDGVPEQAVSDGNGTLYVVMQDAARSVTVVDTKSMKATAHYPLGDKGGCNEGTTEPEVALRSFAASRPDPVLVDLHMKPIDGMATS